MRFLLIPQLYSIPKTAWDHQSGHHHLLCPTGMCLLPIYDCSLFGAMGGSQVLYLHFSPLLHAYRISEGGQPHSNTSKPRVRLTDSGACPCYSSNKATFINFLPWTSVIMSSWQLRTPTSPSLLPTQKKLFSPLCFATNWVIAQSAVIYYFGLCNTIRVTPCLL